MNFVRKKLMGPGEPENREVITWARCWKSDKQQVNRRKSCCRFRAFSVLQRKLFFLNWQRLNRATNLLLTWKKNTLHLNERRKKCFLIYWPKIKCIQQNNFFFRIGIYYYFFTTGWWQLIIGFLYYKLQHRVDIIPSVSLKLLSLFVLHGVKKVNCIDGTLFKKL